MMRECCSEQLEPELGLQRRVGLDKGQEQEEIVGRERPEPGSGGWEPPACHAHCDGNGRFAADGGWAGSPVPVEQRLHCYAKRAFDSGGPENPLQALGSDVPSSGGMERREAGLEQARPSGG